MAYCDDCGLTICYEMGGPCRMYPDGRSQACKIPIMFDDDHTRQLWKCVQMAAREVAAWPAWKRRDGGSHG